MLSAIILAAEFDQLPVFPVSEYQWVLADGFRGGAFAPFLATSSLPLTFSIAFPARLPQDAFYIDNGHVAFRASYSVASLDFFTYGSITARDNRTSCRLKANVPPSEGPCETTISFYLYRQTLAQQCPGSITRISTSPLVVSWSEPSPDYSNLFAAPLTASHASGSIFPVGDTTVSYVMEWDGSEQLSDSLVVCMFQVSLVHTLMACHSPFRSLCLRGSRRS